MTVEVPAAARARLKGLSALVALGAVTSCATGEKILRQPAPTSRFDDAAFFSGRTSGVGVLKVMFRRPGAVQVEGEGHVLGDQTNILDQSVRRVGHTTKQRQLRLRPDGRGGHVGTHSGAVSPVVGTIDGSRLHLVFWLKVGLCAEQWLSLDGNSAIAHNSMLVRKFGMPVAYLTETITRIPR